MIICLRTVVVPPEVRDRYLGWIAEGRMVREAHGILAEWVLEPARGGSGDTVVVTVWPSHEVFDAWIATPERDLLTTSEVHQAVSYRPIVRYDLASGYTNLPGLAAVSKQSPIAPVVSTDPIDSTEEDQP
jgi:heme-degrading monooxygenase HmoA